MLLHAGYSSHPSPTLSHHRVTDIEQAHTSTTLVQFRIVSHIFQFPVMVIHKKKYRPKPTSPHSTASSQDHPISDSTGKGEK